MTTTAELRQSPRKRSTVRPVSNAPRSPSRTKELRAPRTKPDWSNSKLILMSGGTMFRKRAKFLFTSSTTVRVDASARFVTGM